MVKLRRGLDSIEVGMNEREPTLTFADQGEGRAAHVARRHAQPGGEATYERCFPRSQVSKQSQDFVPSQALTDDPSKSIGLSRRP